MVIDKNEKKSEEMFAILQSRLQKYEGLLSSLTERQDKLEADFARFSHTIANSPVVTDDSKNGESISLSSANQNVKGEVISSKPRTCFDARELNPALPSGFYWIDPDGESIGEDPINVFCNMTSGSVFFLIFNVNTQLQVHLFIFLIRLNIHRSRQQRDIRELARLFLSRMLFERHYLLCIKISNRRVGKAIWKMSTIHQGSLKNKRFHFIIYQLNECCIGMQYDCSGAPLESNGVRYSWWEDKNGQPRYFWSGNDTKLQHTCQCGIDKTCLHPNVNCNCDAGDLNETFDEGNGTISLLSLDVTEFDNLQINRIHQC